MTQSQRALKQLIGALKWADDMFAAWNTADDVDIEALTAETHRVLVARRADVLCPAVNQYGQRCVLSNAHTDETPHSWG